MHLFRFLELLALNALWRWGGMNTAGRRLVAALGSPDEDMRTVAGTFLAKGGRRAGPLLVDAVEKRRNLPLTLTLLADLGDDSYSSLIRRHVDDRDPEAAGAARQALRVLELRSPR